MDLVDHLLTILAALDAAGVEYAICGGFAVALHGHVRATKDIDLLVKEEQVPTALTALRPLGWTFVSPPVTFGFGTDRETRLQRVSRIDGERVTTLDLLIAAGPHAEAFASRVRVPHGSGSAVVVGRSALIEMKRRAGRPQDQADVAALLALPSEEP
jgi:hypothetical protein